MKILTVLGARPQFIKASVVSAEFARHTDVAEVVVHTGQHFDANMFNVLNGTNQIKVAHAGASHR